ncbi:MAG TPA: aminoglycoside phosphotransferase [Cellulomonadaceae bacterium]|nr:aminoglycoside phosphotransferase [Cellulomonadaceae bacterium]
MTSSTPHPDHLAPLAATDPALVGLLRTWLPARRWFPAKGDDVDVTSIGTIALADPEGDALVQVVLLRARTSALDTVLQVPVTLREAHDGAEGASSTDAAVIGTIGTPPLVVRDACGDPAFLRAWLAVATGPEDVSPATIGLDTDHPRVIAGEQSNTSVILPGPEGGAILKVFRALSPGKNPDVEIPRALAAVGWWHVPAPLGWLEAGWLDDGAPAVGHLAVLSRFVPAAQDGFELACAMAGDGVSFAPLAEELGAVVAGMHEALAAAIPMSDEDASSVTAHGVADAVAARFRWACDAVPSLTGYAAAVHAVADRAAGLPSVPSAQRIHGDLHLGQALRAQGSWFLTDFEGEPLAPIATRSRPDLPVRDVAGVLRSFDYAAAVGGADEAWTLDAREALLRGYRDAQRHADRADGVGRPAPEVSEADALEILRAVELERALYEAVYEARNRPTWARIPAAALTRLLGPPDL